MSANQGKSKLAVLVGKLKAASSNHGKIVQDQASEKWDLLRKDSLKQAGAPSKAAIAALCVMNPREPKLLSTEEAQQLQALINVAVNRYEQLVNPPNKVGNLIAGVMKEIS
jgi:hypothetical protein